jgi:UDP-glucuronate 4-epimerase
MKLLITGTAGFIGFHFANRMLAEGHEVVGLDSINDYYDVQLKYDRLAEAGIVREDIQYNRTVKSNKYTDYRFVQLQLEDAANLERLFAAEKFDMACHLAAQAGVRYSLDNPKAYIESNITGFLNILEACRFHPVQHLVYASSSSVYGLTEEQPFSVQQRVDHPMSLYAATKKSNELMAHTYSHLFGIPTTGLRFFTVYGPWGRPDMAYFSFAKAIAEGREIKIFNNGQNKRDFTYIDDIVESLSRVMQVIPVPDNALETKAPYRLYNIGNSTPVKLLDFIHTLERALGREARKQYVSAQPGDVVETWADVSDLENATGYRPQVNLEQGIEVFATWFFEYNERFRNAGFPAFA